MASKVCPNFCCFHVRLMIFRSHCVYVFMIKLNDHLARFTFPETVPSFLLLLLAHSMVEVLGKKSSSSGEGNEEKKATIVDLEAIPSDAVNQSSSRDADNVAHISRQDLQSGITKLRNGK